MEEFKMENENENPRGNPYRVEGDENVRRGKHHKAIESYALALKQDLSLDEKIHIHTKRANSYLCFPLNRRAKEDAEEILKIDPGNEEASYLKVRALYGLGQLEAGMKVLEELGERSDKLENVDVFKVLVNSGRKMKKQTKSGKYNLATLAKKELRGGLTRFNSQFEFMGPIKMIADAGKGKGRGVVATQDIPDGAIVLVSKAFAMADVEEGAYGLLERIQKTVKFMVKHEPESLPELLKLYAGQDLQHLDLSPDDINKDTDYTRRIEQICLVNCYCSRTPRYPFTDPWDEEKKVRDIAGLWFFPSFINHLCYGSNATLMIFGDLFIVRSTRPISAGEEINVIYKHVIDIESPIVQRGEFSKRLMFECVCRLCIAFSKMHPKVRDVLQKLDYAMEMEDVPAMKKCLASYEQLENTNFPAIPKEFHVYLIKPLRHIATDYYEKKNWKRCYELLVKAHGLDHVEGLGYISGKPVAFLLNLVQLSAHLEDDEKVAYWLEVLKEELIHSYGTIEIVQYTNADKLKTLAQYGIYIQ